MSEYIERGALLEPETFLQDADGFDYSAVLSVDIRAAKAADVVEVKHGEWVEWWPPKHMILTGEEMLYRCSSCDAKYSNKENMRYCPNCGAKMLND